MKIRNLKTSKVVVGLLSLMSFLTVASAASSFLPESLAKLLGLVGPGGVCASQYITSRVQFVLVLALGGIVLVAVAYALMAAFKYVRSEGESGKMEEAQKSIKAIFIGIAAMIIAVVGIVLVFAVFGAKPADPALYQTCINAPTSAACTSCKESGYVANNKCAKCEDAITKYCKTTAQSASAYLTWNDIKEDDGGSGIRTDCE